jgi:hypothetical protein
MTTPKRVAKMSREATALSGQIGKKYFAGRDPEVVGAALADLMAIFLASHVGDGKDELREELLALHVETVRKLIPINERALE